MANKLNIILCVLYSLQLLFGLIHYSAGCDDHPTAAVFMQLYRLLSCQLQFSPSAEEIDKHTSQWG